MIKAFKVLILVVVLNILPLIGLALAVSHSNDLLVTISYPYDGDLIFNTPLVVTGTITIPSAKVTINGTPVVVAENGYFQGSADLVKGENTIRIIAEIEGMGQVSKVITVSYSPNPA